MLVTDTWWPWAETTVWDVQTGLRLYDLKRENALVLFSQDSTRLLTNLLDKRQGEPDHYLVQIREARSGRVVRALADTVEKLALDLSPDGSKAMTAGADGVARIWDVGSGNLLLELRGHTGRILGLPFHTTGRWRSPQARTARRAYGTCKPGSNCIYSRVNRIGYTGRDSRPTIRASPRSPKTEFGCGTCGTEGGFELK